MDAIVKYADNISAVVVWGTTDDQSWRSSKYPLLFNEDYTAKPSYYQIVDGIDYDQPTTTTTTTAASTTTTTTDATTTTTGVASAAALATQLPAETFCTVTQTATKRLTFQMLL